MITVKQSLIKIVNEHFSKNTDEQQLIKQRLEFLGDSILNFLVSTDIFNTWESSSEGLLSKKRSIIISQNVLACLFDYLTKNHYQQLHKKIKCDVIEIFLGSIYIKKKIKYVTSIYKKHFRTFLFNALNDNRFLDYKSMLQVFCQQNYKCLPKYENSKMRSLRKLFQSKVSLVDENFTIGYGKKISEAEQLAAKEMCKNLKII